MYETKKLYYEDVYKKEFTAKVLECRQGKKGYEVILDQTAFYPEEFSLWRNTAHRNLYLQMEITE